MLAHGMCEKVELHFYTRVRRGIYLTSDLAQRRGGKSSERCNGGKHSSVDCRIVRRHTIVCPGATNGRVMRIWKEMLVRHCNHGNHLPTSPATQCRCGGLDWRRHRCDCNQPHDSCDGWKRRRRGCPAWQVHAPEQDENFLCPAERIRSRFPPRSKISP
jgi:hypothetical protein